MKTTAIIVICLGALLVGVVGILFDSEDPSDQGLGESTRDNGSISEESTEEVNSLTSPLADADRSEVVAPGGLFAAGEIDDLPADDLLTAEVRVRVTSDPGQEPLAAAQLTLTAGMAAGVAVAVPFRDFVVEGTTDEVGLATLRVPPVGVFKVTAACEGYIARSVSPVMSGDEVALALETGHQLEGRLVDDTSGLPVVGARILVTRPTLQLATESDEDGRFMLNSLAEATFKVEILAEGYDIESQVGVRVGEGAGDLGEIRLVMGVQLSGVVLEAGSGNPIPGAAVEVATERYLEDQPATYLQQTAETDDEGLFEIDSVSRTGLSIVARAPGYAAERRYIGVEPDEMDQNIQIELMPGTTVSGKVVGIDGKPIDGVDVSLRGVSADAVADRVVETEQDGTFTFDSVRPWSKFDIVARANERGYAPGFLEGTVVEENKSVTDLEIVLRPGGAVIGQVFDILGEPAPFAMIMVGGMPDLAWELMNQLPHRFADRNGKFTIPGLPIGTVQLSASLGEAYAPPVEMAIVAGGKHEVALRLQQGEVLVGYVLDQDKLPIEGVVVTASTMDPSFRMPPLPRSAPSKPVKQPKGKKGKEAQARAQAAGKKQADLDRKKRVLELAKMAQKYSGNKLVKVATGGATRSASSYRAVSTTDSDGRFVLAGLDDTLLIVVARRDGYGIQRRYGVRVGRELRIIMPLLVSLTGKVIDKRTRFPVPSFEISVVPVGRTPRVPDLPGLLSQRRSRRLSFHSADGGFGVSDLQPGLYAVSASSPAYKNSRLYSAKLSENDSADLVLELTPGAIVRGAVTAGDGSGISGLYVYLNPVAAKESEFETAAADKKKKKLKPRLEGTGRTGQFLFTNVPPGPWELTLSRQSKQIAGPFPILVSEGGEVVQDVRIDSVGNVEIVVRDDRGFKVPRVVVGLKGKAGKAEYRRSTDSNGKVDFQNVLADAYEMSVSGRGYRRKQQSIKVHPNDRVDIEVSIKRKGE